MRKFILVLALSLLGVDLPAAQPGDVVVNEIMWMGTATSSSDEWIELYNTTEQDIDLTNWTLKSADGTPQIVLISTITAHGYYLLERTDDTTVNDITADKIYSGALSDTGESLILSDNYCIEIDSVPCSSGWFAGAKAPNFSMERINPVEGGWFKANWGTALLVSPKAQNSLYYDGTAGDDSDPVTPTADYQVRITEVAFSAATDWVELYNYGDMAIDISAFMLTDLDGTDSRLADVKTTLTPGKYAVVYWDEAGIDETDGTGDLNGNGVIDLYIADTGLSSTDDEIALMSAVSGGQYIDAVCWSTGSGEFASSEDKDVKLLVDNDQWIISGDTVTKSDCWVDSGTIKSDQSIGRRTAMGTDNNTKNDWFLFKLSTPGEDNPNLISPLVILSFDPEPPFKEGQVKISLQIETLNSITEAPQVSFSEGDNGFTGIIMTGSDKGWEGLFNISAEETARNVTIKYKVTDSAKNICEQEVTYLGLAYIPPEYGENMYCYPNPWIMNSGQNLKFSNLGEAESTIIIYTLHGEQVKTLTGLGEIYWDGTNENGEKVAAGIYVYYMENVQNVKKGKFAILK